MDRLHVLGAVPAASMARGGVRVSFDPAIPSGPSVSFGNRVWWYDVHQVEGAVWRQQTTRNTRECEPLQPDRLKGLFCVWARLQDMRRTAIVEAIAAASPDAMRR